jgi:hypothetical protein
MKHCNLFDIPPSGVDSRSREVRRPPSSVELFCRLSVGHPVGTLKKCLLKWREKFVRHSIQLLTSFVGNASNFVSYGGRPIVLQTMNKSNGENHKLVLMLILRHRRLFRTDKFFRAIFGLPHNDAEILWLSLSAMEQLMIKNVCGVEVFVNSRGIEMFTNFINSNSTKTIAVSVD